MRVQPWESISVPELGSVVPPPQIFNSVTAQLSQLETDRDVSIYVCGITPYDATHMGHAATYVAFDTLIRVWRASGAKVTYAQNVTDVDDPLIERAKQIGRQWQDIAVEQTELYKADMEALRVIPPNHFIGAVESIPLVVDAVQKLDQHECVYEVDGDLYYDVTQTVMIGAIGHLSQLDMLDLFASRGGDPERVGKRNRLDPLLWKHERPGDPSWDTEIGKGRPGWHIECAAIAVNYLGTTIDVQGGGSDLKFPHHEMSAAHAQSITGHTPFARTFMHTGMVWLDGNKMSKSLGNLVFVSQLRNSGIDPMAIRLAILAHHYRQDWHWNDSVLADARTRLNTWRAALDRSTHAPDVSEAIGAALANDLDTPAALAVIDKWAKETLDETETHSTNMRQTIDALLGVV